MQTLIGIYLSVPAHLWSELVAGVRLALDWYWPVTREEEE